MPKTRNEEKNANSCSPVVRAELDQGMARTGQFSQQESKVVFELADIDGNGNDYHIYDLPTCIRIKQTLF